MEYQYAMNKYPEIDEFVAVKGNCIWNTCPGQEELMIYRSRGEMFYLVVNGYLYTAWRGNFGKWSVAGLAGGYGHDIFEHDLRKRAAVKYMGFVEKARLQVLPESAINKYDFDDVMLAVKASIRNILYEEHEKEIEDLFNDEKHLEEVSRELEAEREQAEREENTPEKGANY